MSSLIFRYAIGLMLLGGAIRGYEVVVQLDVSLNSEVSASTIRVTPSGSDTSSCGTDVSPCKTIQYAINKASSGDVILVASGTYIYNAAIDLCSFLTTPAVVCYVDKHITLLGGYNEGNWSVSDPETYLTIIDGQNTRRGLAIIAYNQSASLHMEGFTIQNGRAQGTTGGGDFYTFAFGGGLWAQNSSVNLRNVKFLNNRAQGGNTITTYGGAGSGGGLAIQSTKNNVVSELENVTFSGNQALGGGGGDRGGIAIGGGLYIYEATLVGNNIWFQDNLSKGGTSNGNGTDSSFYLQADGLGGAIGVQQNSSMSLTYLTGTNNQAIGGNASMTGGGGFGGGIHVEQATITIADSSFRNNEAVGGNAQNGGVAFGGAIETFNANIQLNRVEVISNVALSGSTTNGGNVGSPGGGGGYFADFQNSHTGTILNSVFADNEILVGTTGTVIGGGGGGLVIQGMPVEIRHATFARNVLGPGLMVGQGILVHGTAGEGGTPGDADIDYAIIAEHSGDSDDSTLHVSQGSTVNLNLVLFAANSKDTNLDGIPLLPGTFNGWDTRLTADSPRFLSSGSPDYDYHLLPDSPAVDQATGSSLTLDIDRQVRPIGGTADIGADEYQVLIFLPLVIH